MMKFLAIAAFLATLPSVVTQECQANMSLEDGSCRPPQPECDIYMAPSTLGDYT